MNQEQTLALWARCQAAKKQTLEALESRANLDEECQAKHKLGAQQAALKPQLDEVGAQLDSDESASPEKSDELLSQLDNILKSLKRPLEAGATSNAKARQEAAHKAAATVWNAWADSGEDDGRCDFSGVRFVKASDSENADATPAPGEEHLIQCDDIVADFTDFRFPGPAIFEKTVFETFAFFDGFEGDALFTGAKFEQMAMFKSFTGLADFSKARFKDDVVFEGDFKNNALFQGTIFDGSELTFRYFHSVFHKQALFDGAVFGGNVSDGSYIVKIDFNKATFLGPASFRSCRFNEACSFKETKIYRTIDFEQADLLGYPPAFEFAPEVRPEQLIGASILMPPVCVPAKKHSPDLSAVPVSDIPCYDGFYIEARKRGDDLDLTYHSDRFQALVLRFKASLPINLILSWPEDELPFNGYFDLDQGYIEAIVKKDDYLYVCHSKGPETGYFEHCYRVPTKRYKTAWDNLIRRLQENHEDVSDSI